MDEWILKELGEIRKQIGSLDDKCENIDLAVKATNEILYLLLEQFADGQSFEMGEECEKKLMIDNIGIISLNKRASIDWVRKKLELKGRQIKVIDEPIRVNDLFAKLNNLCNEEVVFINCVYLNTSKELTEALREAILHNCIIIKIGRGDSARTVSVELSSIHYILYAPETRFFPSGLIKDENIFSPNNENSGNI